MLIYNVRWYREWGSSLSNKNTKPLPVKEMSNPFRGFNSSLFSLQTSQQQKNWCMGT